MRPRRSRVVPAVVTITATAVLLRTIELGARIFHWDEGRVGYWAYRFHETGVFRYRPIIHGPFLPVVDNALFDVLGATDFAARLPVAIVGGLLPLVALTLRDHLSDRETIGLALVLAVDPLLVYYSRFMRSDVLVGAFAFTAFALVVAAVSRERTALFVPAAASLGVAFTAKENALVYVLCFVGASLLLLDHRLVRTASGTDSGLDAAVAAGIGLARRADRWTAGGRVRGWASDRWNRHVGITAHVAVWVPVVTLAAAAAYLSVTLFFYAPRPGIWEVLAGTRPAEPVVRAGTVGAVERFAEQWVTTSHGNPYLAYVADLGETLIYGSAVTVALAAIGFVADGYGGDGSRGLVAFAGYWAAASLVGYPVATDIQAPWAAVHVVLPLSIPAAVGLARLLDTIEASLTDEAYLDVGLAALVVIAATGGVVAANVDYWNTADREDDQIVQWAQPGNELRSAVPVMAAIAADNDGPDALFVGTVHPATRERVLHLRNESSADQPVPGGGWFDRLPLPWYLAVNDVQPTSTSPDARYDGLPADPPPIVLAYGFDAPAVAERLPGYTSRTFAFRLWRDEITVFVDRDALARVDGEQAAVFTESNVSRSVARSESGSPWSVVGPLAGLGLVGVAVRGRRRL